MPGPRLGVSTALRRVPWAAPRAPAPSSAPTPSPASGKLGWRPAWSVPAAMRTVRAVVVIPSLFAITYEGLGNLQLALFAAFGGFASLVVASFGGSARDKVIAHLTLAVTGSVALIIGTAVGGITWLAALVTIPVAFGIFFAGVAGPNAASGVTAALFAYVLPVASPSTPSMIPDRLAGWWLASVVSAAAVLLFSPPSPGDRLRAAAARSARRLAAHLDASAGGRATAADVAACQAAKHELLSAFATTPYRPTGLATADQGLASVVQLLEWCTVLLVDATQGHPNLDQAAQCDRDLLGLAAGVLREAGDMLAGDGPAPPSEYGPVFRGPGVPAAAAGLADVAALDRQRATCAAEHRDTEREGDYDSVEIVARHAFHAQVISIAAEAILADTLIATRRADPETVAARRRGWFGAQPEGTMAERRAAALTGAIGVLVRHASFRSVWFLNALRGSLALAAAVLVADLSGVQHGFWVVLGTLSVLRTNAASTGSTALRALGGTAAGFVAGAVLLLIIGTSTPALWVVLPIAIAVAAYAPGTMPFAYGQAAFTVVVVVLFNLLVPAGWKVGLLRIEDVALGCLVSLVVGVLFWPRGASSVVGDDLADAFRRDAAYLTQAVDWALGSRKVAPDAGAAAVTTATRLDEALRGFLAEQGAKKVSKEELWTLVMATTRLRLTAYSLAGMRAPEDHHHPHRGTAYARTVLTQATADLVAFYDRVAVLVARPAPHQVLLPVSVPPFTGLNGSGPANGAGGTADGGAAADLVRVITAPHHPHLLWVHEHLQHLSSHAGMITEPASHVAEQRRLPWWR
ncbi:MAG: FUSC family protein [Streptosporangiaceae bacterium]